MESVWIAYEVFDQFAINFYRLIPERAAATRVSGVTPIREAPARTPRLARHPPRAPRTFATARREMGKGAEMTPLADRADARPAARLGTRAPDPTAKSPPRRAENDLDETTASRIVVEAKGREMDAEMDAAWDITLTAGRTGGGPGLPSAPVSSGSESSAWIRSSSLAMSMPAGRSAWGAARRARLRTSRR